MKMPSLTWLAQSVERGSNKVRIQYMKRTNKYKTNSNIQLPLKTTAQGHGCKCNNIKHCKTSYTASNITFNQKYSRSPY